MLPAAAMVDLANFVEEVAGSERLRDNVLERLEVIPKGARMEDPVGMRSTILSCLASLVVGCGSPGLPSVEPSPTASAAAEPSVSNVVRTRLPKETPCGEGDVCGFYLQVISPGSEAEHLTDGAMKLLRGHCGGAVIVYRDKRGVMGAGSVFKTEHEKRACAAALGRTSDVDDYPSAAVWRKSD